MSDNAFPTARTALAILAMCVCGGGIDAALAQERLREHEFALSSGRVRGAAGIASDGATMWVTDRYKLHAYDLVTKEEVLEKFVDLQPRLPLGRGAWDFSIDGTTMWLLLVGNGGIGLAGYDLATGESKGSFSLRLESAPQKIGSDGATMWFVPPGGPSGSGSRAPHKLVAFDLGTGVLVPGRDVDLDLPPTAFVVDIWPHGSMMWVVTGSRGYGAPYTLAAHDIANGAPVPDKSVALNLAGVAAHPTSIWSDGRTMWVQICRGLPPNGCSYSTLLAYDMTTRARAPANDFGSLTQGWAAYPNGIWSDGATMWVGDGFDSGRLYAYDMATKMRKPDEDFNTLHTGSTGLWSDGSTMWVHSGFRVSAYDMTTKVRKPDEDFEVGEYQAGVRWQPEGDIWSDGTTMWFVGYDFNIGSYGLYAYDMATKLRRPEADFENLGAGEYVPIRGISSDGSTMWVADYVDRKLVAYDMSTRARAPTRDIEAPQINLNYNYRSASGMWSDGSTIWVADNWYNNDDFEEDRHDKANLFAYDIATKARVSDKELFTLTLDGARTFGAGSAWSDGVTMWVADAPTGRLYAYDLAARARVPNKDFSTLNASGNSDPVGIWSDGVTMWVADGVDRKLYAYDLVNRARAPSRDFDLGIERVEGLRDIWSDGATMWVLVPGNGRERSKLRAFDMATRGPQPTRDIIDIEDLDFENTGQAFVAQAIWSDGVTMWVGGRPNARTPAELFAFDLATGQRDEDKNFRLPDSVRRVHGIWSDRQKMWVVGDDGVVRVYAWPHSNRSPEPVGTLAPMTLEEHGSSRLVEVSGAFRDPEGDALSYAATSSSLDVVWAWVPDDPGTRVVLSPASEGTALVTVTATDREGSNTSALQTFTVTVVPPSNRPPEAVGAVAPLAIVLDEAPVRVEVSGAFRDPEGDALTYAATSSSPGVAAVTVSESTVTVTPLSRGTSLVTVTARDAGGSNGVARQTFTVTVSAANRPPEPVRTLPAVTLGVDAGPVAVEVAGAFRDPDGDALTLRKRCLGGVGATVSGRGTR